ncbi:hypothetical protein [Sulfuracidifex metallicus]|uniref:hypothetical protein n=1 Tax=Sulfuracidifex metallicus TaxID=47303 RepID=UPI000ABB2021|nr:hypothetical protein [Sulfuracidifex metallicus]
MKPTVEIYPGLSLPIDELEKLVDKYLIIGGTPPRIMAVTNDDEEARNRFLDLSEKADLNRETDFPKAIIFLTRDMLKPYYDSVRLLLSLFPRVACCKTFFISSQFKR